MSDIDFTTHCPFPAHKGQAWQEVVEKNQSYAEWLISAEGPDMDEEMYMVIEDALIEWGSFDG